MMLRALLALATLALSPLALADEPSNENKDLELIPSTAPVPPSSSAELASPAGVTRKLYLENAFTQSWTQSGLLVPFPPPQPSIWEERLLLDVRDEWPLGQDIRVAYSGRLNLRAEDRLDFPSHENAINDLREAYFAWEPTASFFADVGRINLKSGVALGFNPTDFFKTRAVVEPLSVDPVVLREDRLGTLLLRAQRIWPRGSLTVAYAPAVASASPIYTDFDLPSLDPMFDRTNAKDRFLVKGSVDIAAEFSPEILAYHEDGVTRWGLNLTQPIGQKMVLYAEWSGGPRTSLIDDALRFGRATGTLPPNAPSPLPEDEHQQFRSELAAGASYALAESKITLNLELNYSQAGFSRTDWLNWFRVGSGATSQSPIAAELWYIRDYALDQQEQVSRSYVFLRGDWVDAFVPRLELTGFVSSDLADGSARIQLTADYYLTDRWTIGGLVLANFGAHRSDFGSLPQAGSVLLKIVRYF